MGCSTARNKGTCDNRRTIKREALEALVLSGLKHQLMEPELCTGFAEEYARHLNQLRLAKTAGIEAAKSELVRVAREHEKLIVANCNGVPAERVKDRMWELDARQKELEVQLDNAEEDPVLIHPNMGKLYREQVSRPAQALNDESIRAEASELLRSLIDRITVTPDPKTGKPVIDLEGDLAGILSLSQTIKNAASVREGDVAKYKLVAGVGFEPTTFRL